MIHGDFAPLRSGAAAQAQCLRQRNDAPELLCSYGNCGISFSHTPVYSTAKPVRSSPAIPVLATAAQKLAMTLGKRIRAARKAAGKTLDQVAEQIGRGLTKGAVSQWENDRTVPELEYFIDFCRFVGASADFLLLGRGDVMLGQLVAVYEELQPDGRDTLMLRAHRLRAETQPGADGLFYAARNNVQGATVRAIGPDFAELPKEGRQSRGLEEPGDGSRTRKTRGAGKKR